MLFAFGMIVILAVIGIFVCLIAGAFVINSIVRRHVHVLQKWTRTQEYVVADLAHDDGMCEKDIRSNADDGENMEATVPLVQRASRSVYRSLEVDRGAFNV